MIELLVVILILALVVTAIGACLSAGIDAWDQARTFNVNETEAVYSLFILEKDLMNTFRFYGTRFEGTTAELVLPALVDVKADAGTDRERGGRSIGSVKYSYDPEGKRLIRKAWAFGGAEPEAGWEKVAGNVEGVELEYLGGAEWLPSWSSHTNLPAAVRIGLVFRAVNGTLETERTFVLPAGGNDVR